MDKLAKWETDMLTFHLEPEGMRSVWERDPHGGWHSAGSTIRPFRNVALESGLYTHGTTTTVFIVRERLRGQDFLPTDLELGGQEVVDLLSLTRSWAGDFTILEIGGEVRVSVGLWGSAPIYLAASEKSFSGSWDLLDHVSQPHGGKLDDRTVVEFLTRMPGYSARTVLGGVQCLTERAVASWIPGSALNFLPPVAGEHYLSRALRADSQPVPIYGSLLRSAVARRDLATSDVAVEVSGGTDSATVALGARVALGPGEVRSYGLLIGGAIGRQQRVRRRALVGLGNLIDETLDAEEQLPLAPAKPGQLINPCEEPYGDALSVVLARVQRPVVLTGIGGDELFALRSEEQDESITQMRPLPRFLSRWARDIARDLDAQDPELPVSVVPGGLFISSKEE